MIVEELVIDGFKSYAVRTVISSWDPQFNAITGLNGSGKSNILDAICFVLGITSMTTVRASNLQDLIYKRGQAGITKASVTITFDNSNKAKSPFGFEDKSKISITRQIVLGGASKYLINGHKAQQIQVLNLFQSVQLNINNPNFLIMQGKITKMLNMKPTEILGLIEEAAGTKMYETEKAKAENTMRKKNKKLTETEDLLKEEVEPKLKHLRDQKRTVLEFQETQIELETLAKMVSAHDYKSYRDAVNNHESKAAEAKEALAANKLEIETLNKEIATLEKDLEKMKADKQKESEKGNHLKELEATENSITNDITRLTTTKDLKLQNIEEQTKKLSSTLKELENLQNSINNESQINQLEADYQKCKQELENDRALLQRKEDLLSTLSTGISSKGSTDGGYMAHLQEARKKLSDVDINIKQDNMKIQRLLSAIESNKPKIENALKELEKFKNEIESRRRQCDVLNNKMQNIGFDVERFNTLKAQHRSLQDELAHYSMQLQDFKRSNHNFDFTYDLPSPNFNRNSVKGLAGELFTTKSEESRTALEVCAGSRVFNVVVDTEITGSQLLDKGRLTKRVTIIPLNKVSARMIDPRALAAAKAIAPNDVQLALDLLEYDPNSTKAMQYIFGNRLICKDPDTAQKVTFDPRVRTSSITLDGDTYDPEGRLSGGSRRQTASVLKQFEKFNALKRKVDEVSQQLNGISNELAKLSQLSEKTQSIQHDLKMEQHQIAQLENQLEQGTAKVLVTKNEANVEEVSALHENIETLKETRAQLTVEIESIEKDMNEFNNNGSSKLHELKQEVQKLSSALKSKEKQVKDAQSKYQNFQVQKEQISSDIAELEKEQKDSEKLIEELQQDLTNITGEIQSLNSELSEIHENVEAEKARMMSINEELNELSSVLNQKRKDLNDSNQRLSKSESSHQTASSSLLSLQERLQDIVESQPWVKDDKLLQNVLDKEPNLDPKYCHARIELLDARCTTMKRKGINNNIMAQIEQHEKHETALRSKIKQINKDKANIESTIVKLDNYKKSELSKTYEKVSDDFGLIFSDLLPHAYAKLVPVSATDITQGLEVKVKLGSVWKESLVELSGGQRSLVALSLILSLLQFKPAPMYILDEVDAALDLSHTQNIGHLIKTRFKGSQFIVVSLKEGMFTNANRLFKVRFQEGTSVVTAT